MANKTIGVIETEGLLDAFLASDAMIKGANVELTARYLLGGGCGDPCHFRCSRGCKISY